MASNEATSSEKKQDEDAFVPFIIHKRPKHDTASEIESVKKELVAECRRLAESSDGTISAEQLQRLLHLKQKLQAILATKETSEEVSKMDETTPRLKSELLVYGYCKHNSDQHIPDWVIDICINYYHFIPPKFDSTLGGIISWKKIADFSALLPRIIKFKLWNGAFKTEEDHQQPEVERISKVLRTYAMLQLTRVW